MKKLGMVIGLKIGLALFCASMFLSGMAFAEDVKPAAPAVSADDVKKALGISFYLQGGYTYNGNASNVSSTQSDENDWRVFDHKANSFGLDLAQIVFFKDAAAGTIGYKIKLSAGETAKWIHSRGLSGAPLDQPQYGEGTNSLDLTEAYVSYVAPIGKGIRFDLGKMVTYFGAEVIEAKDNPNYSRSLLFNYAIPFTHTGLKMSYGFTDALSASAFVVNGWDNTEDNNPSKSYGVSIGYAPAELFSGYVNYMIGPEQDATGPNAPTVGSSSGNERTLLDLVATIKPVKALSIILNYDDGKEDHALAGVDAKWSGYAGIVKYDFNDTYSLAVRGEEFKDKNGFRTGFPGGQKLTEVTVTPEIRLTGGLIIRPEYRHDSSDQMAFDMVDGAFTKKSQDTIALGVMYSW
jgi:hypothetical protein